MLTRETHATPERPSRCAWRDRRPTCGPRSACATRCSRSRWAPACRARRAASIATAGTTSAITCWSASARSDRVVGTYRMLPPARARGRRRLVLRRRVRRRAPAAGERDRIVEVGRACVDPAYRTGLVIALLWAGLMRYLRAARRRLRHRLRQHRHRRTAATSPPASAAACCAITSRQPPGASRRARPSCSRAGATSPSRRCRRCSRATCASAPRSAGRRPGIRDFRTADLLIRLRCRARQPPLCRPSPPRRLSAAHRVAHAGCSASRRALARSPAAHVGRRACAGAAACDRARALA